MLQDYSSVCEEDINDSTFKIDTKSSKEEIYIRGQVIIRTELDHFRNIKSISEK